LTPRQVERNESQKKTKNKNATKLTLLLKVCSIKGREVWLEKEVASVVNSAKQAFRGGGKEGFGFVYSNKTKDNVTFGAGPRGSSLRFTGERGRKVESSVTQLLPKKRKNREETRSKKNTYNRMDVGHGGGGKKKNATILGMHQYETDKNVQQTERDNTGYPYRGA